MQVMFEQYGFNAIYIAVQAVLTLYAEGLQTGVVVDSGDGVTHICPVFEGFSLNHLTKRLDIAGRDITRQLIKVLQKWLIKSVVESNNNKCFINKVPNSKIANNCYVMSSVVTSARLRLQSFGRFRDGSPTEGEVMLCGLRCGARGAPSARDDRPHRVLHGTFFFGFKLAIESTTIVA